MARRERRKPETPLSSGPQGVPSTADKIEAEPNPIKKVGKILGPGFVTGASDDDPSGIGTYAVAGATLGLATLWTALLTFPLMASVQSICARVGMVSGHGLAGVLRDHYPRPLLYGSVVLLFVANTINVGADLGAIADAVHAVIGVQAVWLVVPVAAGIVALQIFGSYRLICNVFKWLTLALFAYVVDAFIVHPDLAETLRATIVPTVSLDPAYVTTIVAILGTTISPYLFFWQSSEEVEEEISEGRVTVEQRSGASDAEMRYSMIDTVVGMGFSNLIMYFIILATALTLFKSGETNIKSAADAAEALKPLAGDFASILFAVGMIGAGLLAVPILSGSAAYAVAEAFGWRYGLDHKWSKAKEFYAVIIVATALGSALNFLGIDPIDALFWTAVINGVIAPPLLVLVMLAARNERVMGDQRIGPVLTTFGWLATVGMFLALIAFIATSLVK
jgi:NRAMP (natural resistance-associated macrophage protein)-like metal ion transporter